MCRGPVVNKTGMAWALALLPVPKSSWSCLAHSRSSEDKSRLDLCWKALYPGWQTPVIPFCKGVMAGTQSSTRGHHSVELPEGLLCKRGDLKGSAGGLQGILEGLKVEEIPHILLARSFSRAMAKFPESNALVATGQLLGFGGNSWGALDTPLYMFLSRQPRADPSPHACLESPPWKSHTKAWDKGSGRNSWLQACSCLGSPDEMNHYQLASRWTTISWPLWTRHRQERDPMRQKAWPLAPGGYLLVMKTAFLNLSSLDLLLRWLQGPSRPHLLSPWPHSHWLLPQHTALLMGLGTPLSVPACSPCREDSSPRSWGVCSLLIILLLRFHHLTYSTPSSSRSMPWSWFMFFIVSKYSFQSWRHGSQAKIEWTHIRVLLPR